jgi:hypothetical protein
VFPPQQTTVPSDLRAQLLLLEAASAVTPLSPCTATGVSELLVVPFPSCPPVFKPQQATVPFWSNAHEW